MGMVPRRGLPHSALLVGLIFWSISSAWGAATVTGTNLVSSVRTGRSTYQYTYTINVQNASVGLTSAAASVTSSDPNTVVVKGTVTLGTLQANSTSTSTDTFVIQQNRLAAFNPSALSWSIRGIPSQYIVPEVTGDRESASAASVGGAGLSVGTVTLQASSSVPPGFVISEAPAAGSVVAPGSTVSLVVSTGMPPVAQGTLAPGVLALTDSQLAAIASETSSAVVFNGPVLLSPGSVFITNDNAFYVVSSAFVAGQTQVDVQPAALEQVFSSLQIAGTFPISANGSAVAGSLAGSVSAAAGQVAANAMTSLPVTYTVSAGFSVAGTIDLSLGPADFAFSMSPAGTTSYLNIPVAGTGAITFTASASGSAAQEFNVTTITVPVRVSIADALLSWTGLRLVQIRVPISAQLGINAQLQASATGSLTVTGDIGARYDNGALSGYNTVKGAAVVSATPSSSVTANASIDTYAYLHVRPALAFLNTVLLAGADLVVGPHEYLTFTYQSNQDPTYCAKFEGKLHGTASLFLKGLNFPEKTTPSIGGEVPTYTSEYPTACGATQASVVTLTPDPDTAVPAFFFEPATIDAVVTPAASGSSIPAPTGDVTISLGGGPTCTANLVNGSGRCTLLAEPATGDGAQVAVTGSYRGDNNYRPADGFTTISILQSPSQVTTLNTDPTIGISGQQLTVSATVAPSPQEAGEPYPTGPIDFLDANTGALLCSTIIAGGDPASCSFSVPGGVANLSIFAAYRGNTNFLASNKTIEIPVQTRSSAATATTVLTQSTCPISDPVRTFAFEPTTTPGYYQFIPPSADSLFVGALTTIPGVMSGNRSCAAEGCSSNVWSFEITADRLIHTGHQVGPGALDCVWVFVGPMIWQ